MNDVEYCNKSQSHNKRGAAIRNIFVNTENEEEAQYIIIASIEKETDLIKCGEFTKIQRKSKRLIMVHAT